MGRMTLQGALRFDHAWSYSPEQTIGPAHRRQTSWRRRCTFAADRRRQLQGHLAARRRGLGRVRQRQDGRQGQRRQVRGSGEQPEQQLLDQQPDRAHRDDDHPHVDRQRARTAGIAKRQRPAVRLHEHRPPTASAAAWRSPTFGTATPHHGGDRSEPAQRLGHPSERLADRRVGPAAAGAARVGRGRLLPPLAAATSRRPTTRSSRRATSRRSASRRRPIRDCPAAAATRSPVSTTSCQASSARRSNNITDAANFGDQYQSYNGILINFSARAAARA